MNRRGWIYLLVAVGVGLAILIGLLGSCGEETQAEAQQDLCSSLSSLDSSINSLTSLNVKTASKEDYQSDVSDIQDDWNNVKDDAQDLKNIDMNTLDSAWNSFKAAVDNVPDDASVSDAVQDVSQQAKALESTAKSTLTGLNCT